MTETPAAPAPEGRGLVSAADGAELYVSWEGDGPGAPVVLCDGIACDGFIWKYLRPALAEVRRVVHWHYRAHGRSSAPKDLSRIHIADHAADLHAVLAHLRIDRAVLIGHSMGTQVCLEAYRQRPEAVAGMVLACGSYGNITRTFKGSDALLHAIPRVLALIDRHPVMFRALWQSGPAELLATASRWLGEVDALRIRTEDMVPYFEHIARMDPALFFRMLSAAGSHSAEDLLPSIRVPVLVLAAERDSFTPVRLAEQMARQIPGAQIVRLEGASHAAPLEQRERVNEAVTAFLADLP